MIAACLQAAGYRVGLYTSPHLQEFRDRIRVLTPDDEEGRITESEVIAGVETMKPCIDLVPDITWFELITALAFLHFGQQQIDVAVVEVGLGGRLDATNVLTPLISVITSVSYDQTYLLGDTLAEIAGEKAGIVKHQVPVVLAPQAPEAQAKIERIAGDRDAPLTLVGRDWRYQPENNGRSISRSGRVQRISVTPPSGSTLIPKATRFELSLAGAHQQENAVVALAALEGISERFPSLDLAAVKEGLANVFWPGRLQMLHSGDGTPSILLDCAHNVDSAEKLVYALQHDYDYQRLWLVLGATADKDVAGIVNTLLPLADGTIMTTSGHPRAANPDDLIRLATEGGFEAQASPSVDEAVLQLWAYASPDDLICVTGSIFVVGDLLNQWDSLQSQLRLNPAGAEN
jgi:dihydrofolate synthase/folylpolyglutamate synthase